MGLPVSKRLDKAEGRAEGRGPRPSGLRSDTSDPKAELGQTHKPRPLMGKARAEPRPSAGVTITYATN